MDPKLIDQYKTTHEIATPSRQLNPSLIQSIDTTRTYGLTTSEALLRLHNDIELEVILMKNEFSKQSLLSWLRESVSFKSELSKMRWPSVLFMIGQAIAHFIVACILTVKNPATDWVGFQGLILTSLLAFNLSINLWDTKLRFKELLMKSEQLLRLIKQCSKDKHLLRHWRHYNWMSAQAKTLFAPKSPCVNQTITYRDDSCLNLSDYLLVRGDIIHLFPGEKAPGDCESLGTFNGSGENDDNNKRIYLKEGQVFHDPYETRCSDNIDNQFNLPGSKNDSKNLMIQFSHAKLKRSNRGTDFLMLSTPYISSLHVSLQQSHKRPVNSVEKECFIISRKYFETFVIPSVFILSTIVTAIHYGYLDLTDSDQKIKTISIAYLLLRPSLTIMPFLPWMFPCFWLAVNAYGSAKLLCCAEAQLEKESDMTPAGNNQHYSPEWTHKEQGNSNTGVPSRFENLLATPTAAGSSENKHDEEDLHYSRSKVGFVVVFRVFIDLVIGKSGHVWRSSSLLQVLGCLTSLCCIDKVGILSWSNPTPEKVFVLTKNQNNESRYLVSQHNQSDELDSQNQTDDHAKIQTMLTLTRDFTISKPKSNSIAINDDQISTNFINMKPSIVSYSRPEVLDLSHTINCYRGFSIESLLSQPQGRLQFDDLNWKKFINNLKPLGLAILMNNCCEKSFGDYFRFYKHISYESILRCNLTPVVKRRCICSLSKLIGFSKDATDTYKYSNQIGVYKLIDPKSIKKGKLVSSLEHTTRLKLPFPNMICNIHQDTATGGYQVFSQGTADIILDACVEYWSGSQLVPLDESTRKKIMDFYHRTSLTSYCSAFSYTPLLNEHKFGDKYIELPPENSKFAPHLRKLANEYQEELLQNQVIKLPSQTTNSKHHKSSSLDSHESITYNQTDYHQQAHASFTPLGSGKPESVSSQVIRRHLSVEDLHELNRPNKMGKNESRKKVSKKSRDLSETLDELADQVFVGMVSMQYQACADFVALVEQLEHACIRFVHFSKENELRSRVFSEKMGLESGWNCHISLQSDQDLSESEKRQCDTPKVFQNLKKSKEDHTKVRSCFPSTRISNILGSTNRPEADSANVDVLSSAQSISSDERTLYSWKSLPSLIMTLTAKLSSINYHNIATPEHGTRTKSNRPNYLTEFTNYNLVAESECGEETILKTTDRTSMYDDSSIKEEEGFESLAFDMSNRAKLPKGIENIRPHLETVDNVPLQVSLFTDCTPDLTQEMIGIMQEYGEIVCVIGSSSSRMNTSVFLQANASISIEPLLPQTCTRIEDKLQRTLDRELRKSKRLISRRNDKLNKVEKLTASHKSEQEPPEFVSVNINPRPVNPRDRLGIGPSEPQIRPKPRRRSNSSSSSSSSSSSGSSSFSSSSSTSPAESECEFDIDESECIPESSKKLLRDLPFPSSLASKLSSLPCSYSYNRKDQVNLYSLIMEARHFTFKMKNTFVCMICFALSISSAQFLASLLFLPPMLSSGLTIWLTVVVVPLLSLSLMSTTMDSQVMKIAVGKNLQLKPENITFFVLCYLIKFIPSIIVVVLSYGLIIAHSCKLTGFGSSSLGPCWMFTYVQHGNATSTDTGDEDLLWSAHLLTAQVCTAFLLVLYFVVISAEFVHRSHLLWQKSPTRNHLWVIISVLLIFGQLFYNQLVLQVNLSSSKISHEFLASLPLHIWLISFLSPILVIGINLMVKRAEIKATIRQQRRARFDFNTKLGMNSPF